MRCSTCQTETPDDTPFCRGCGALFYQQCETCGHRNEPSGRFCVECGNRLGQLQAKPTSGPATSIIDPSGFQAEKKLVTVFFADIVNSTSLIEHLEPDDAAEQLHHIMETMRDGIRRFGGSVNKLQGDGVMAIFGAPYPQEDHAVQACSAALAVRDAISRLQTVSIRVGIHTGETVVQAVRNDLSSQYEAMGVAVHIAARAEQIASPSEIIITEATLRSARALVSVEPLGARTLKGITQPVELFRLKGTKSIAASQQFLGGQRISAFIARAEELSQLTACLARAQAGASQVVGIVGDPGVGKSRLAFEFVSECRAKGMPVVEARATAHAQLTPLQPILDLLRSFFGISGTDAGAVALQKITGRLGEFGLSSETASVAAFLGIASPDSRIEPSLQKDKPTDVVRRICQAVGRQSPGIVLFEDVHWLDEASVPFLDALVEGFTASKVFLLVNFRPGFHRDWMDNSGYSQIELLPLPTTAIDRIVHDLIGGHPSTEALRAQIVDRAHGNPFFAEEIVRALADRRVLVGERGNYTTTEPGAASALPNTVRGVISFRIDRLEEAQKRFLEAASVIGREFSASVAAEVGGIDQTTADTQVRDLLGLEMIYGAGQGDSLSFKHPLLQEVAYASLVSERRKFLHRRAAKALSVHFAKMLNEHAALIARHWEEGGDPVQAASHYMMSATWIGTRDPAQAVRTWEQVRALTSPSASHAPSKFMRLMACGQIINLSWRESAAQEKLEPVYREGKLLAQELKDVRAAALLTMAYGRALLVSGSVDDYLAGVKEAQEMLAESPNNSVAALLAAVESHATGQAGFLRRALHLNALALGNVHSIDAADRRTVGFNPEHWLKTLRTRYLLWTGDPQGSERLIGELLGTDGLDLTHRVMALGVSIDAAALDQHPSRAREAARELDEISLQSVPPYVSVLSEYFRGVSLLAANEYRMARATLSNAIDLAVKFRTGLELEPAILTNLAEATASEGLSGAAELAIRARELARRRSARVTELLAISCLLRILAKTNARVDAELHENFERLLDITGAERLKSRSRILI